LPPFVGFHDDRPCDNDKREKQRCCNKHFDLLQCEDDN
jgi:hypothetical protein